MKKLDVKELSREALEEQKAKLGEELLKLRFQHSARQLKNPLALRWGRRNLARVLTALRIKESKS